MSESKKARKVYIVTSTNAARAGLRENQGRTEGRKITRVTTEYELSDCGGHQDRVTNDGWMQSARRWKQ